MMLCRMTHVALFVTVLMTRGKGVVLSCPRHKNPVQHPRGIAQTICLDLLGKLVSKEEVGTAKDMFSIHILASLDVVCYLNKRERR